MLRQNKQKPVPRAGQSHSGDWCEASFGLCYALPASHSFMWILCPLKQTPHLRVFWFCRSTKLPCPSQLFHIRLGLSFRWHLLSDSFTRHTLHIKHKRKSLLFRHMFPSFFWKHTAPLVSLIFFFFTFAGNTITRNLSLSPSSVLRKAIAHNTQKKPGD